MPGAVPADRDFDDVWMIIPVYNEAQVIGGVVDAALLTFPHIVCVDDGSRDRSGERILATRAHLVSHPVNLGQGAPLQTGLDYARRQPAAEHFVTSTAAAPHRVEAR